MYSKWFVCENEVRFYQSVESGLKKCPTLKAGEPECTNINTSLYPNINTYLYPNSILDV